VMEYMAEGNLKQANEQRKITLEETRTVFRQTLKALHYLHDDQKITHRGIKPENILLYSRTPNVSIKLCDFGLATNNQDLKTRCGTAMYAAAEIYSQIYDNSVDIWATAVVALEFLIGLPTNAKGIQHSRWCTKVRQSIETICGQAHDPLMLLLKQMLELTPGNRPSAQACLADQSMMSMRQPSPSPFEPRIGVAATEVSSEQSTQILLPLADGQGGWDRPTTPQGSSKRLRFSRCSVGSQVDDSQKQPSANYYLRPSPAPRNLETNRRKVHIVVGRTGLKTIAKPQTAPLDNVDEVFSPSRPDDGYAGREKDPTALS